ncbi:MAG: hypothetical protein ACI8X5_000614 [Planctomycetota bacterium]|jgi:hypothetical protein
MESTNGRFVIGLLLGAAIGVALGFLAAGSEERTEEDLALVAPASATTQALARSDAASANSLPFKSQVDRRQKTPDIAAVAIVEGTGTIRGRVFDESGQALPGVLLQLHGVAYSGLAQPTPGTESLDEVLRSAAERFHEVHDQSRDMRSAGDGTFLFDHLPDVRWDLAANLTGYEIIATSITKSIRNGSDVEFIARAVLEVPLHVFAPDGSEIESALINTLVPIRPGEFFMGGERPENLIAWSKNTPVLRLLPGVYELTAYSTVDASDGLAKLASETATVHFEWRDSVPTINLHLRGRLGIRGTARLAKGDPAGDLLHVKLLPMGPQQELDLNAVLYSVTARRIEPGAEYSFLDLEPGRYVVGVSRGWYSAITRHEIIELSGTGGIVQCDLDLPPVDRSRAIHISATGPNGRGLSGVRFTMEVKRGMSASNGHLDSLFEGQGKYLLLLAMADEAAYFDGKKTSVTLNLEATHPLYGQQTVKLGKRQREVQFTFSTPGSLKVTILGYDGSGREGRLRIQMTNLEDPSTAQGLNPGNGLKIGPGGTLKISGITPGRYQVSLMSTPNLKEKKWTFPVRVNQAELEVLPGENHVQLDIPRLYALRVHCARGEQGRVLSLSPLDREGPMRSASLDTQGFAVWEELEAGEYQLIAGKSFHEVTIPCGDLEIDGM